MRNRSLKRAMDGMVASPTPMMPISSDSTNVMATRGPITLASAAAAIHPAVPPPAITIDLTCGVATRLSRTASSELVAYGGRVDGPVLLVLDDINRRRAHLVQHERLVGQIAAGHIEAQAIQSTFREGIADLRIEDRLR